MDIYFVRHGETSGNLAHRHQQENSRLTARGDEQAAAVAAIAASLNPTHLIVSDRVRAVETGQAIAIATDLVPERSSLFTELCRPQAMYGFKHHSRKSIIYLLHWYSGRLGGDDCGPEGESYAAFRQRIANARAYLEALPADARVVVVSHSVFITLFCAHLHQPQPLSWWGALRAFRKLRKLPNGSLVHLSFDTVSGWQLHSFGRTSTS